MSLLHEIALTLIPGVGDVNGRRLVSYCGSAEAVFSEKKARLIKIPGIGEVTAEAVYTSKTLERAGKELEFIRKYHIRPLFFTHTDYPARLKNCQDAPLMLYYRGNADLNPQHCLSIVGTRRATSYGREFILQLLESLQPFMPLIVSGLAFGVDTAAHRHCMALGIPTVAVLGHGLDRIYPYQNKALAQQMASGAGGLLTDFPSGTNPDRENFPKRNRIIAGLSEATVVIETGKRGGSLITADIANSYNRDVFALPGRAGDTLSEGCNWLIKSNRAALMDSPEDLMESLGWKLPSAVPTHRQHRLFIQLTPDEEALLSIFELNEQPGIDTLCIESQLPASRVAAALLNLEFNGLIKCLPGKVYKKL